MTELQTGQDETGDELKLAPQLYQLAILGLVDYEGNWEALLLATSWVIDGSAKRSLIIEKLLPRAAELRSLREKPIGPRDLISAREWFRYRPCTPIEREDEERATP